MKFCNGCSDFFESLVTPICSCEDECSSCIEYHICPGTIISLTEKGRESLKNEAVHKEE